VVNVTIIFREDFTMEHYIFDADDYIEMYSHYGISVYRFDYPALLERYNDIPAVVVTYNNEYFGELSNVPTFMRNVRDILLHFYKGFAYEYFQKGDTWRGSTLELAIREAYTTLVGNDIWHIAAGGNWYSRWNSLPLDQLDTLSQSELEHAMRLCTDNGDIVEVKPSVTAMGTLQFMGGTGAGMSNSSLMMTMTISTNLTEIPSMGGPREYSKHRLVLSDAVAMGHRLPTWKELYLRNRDLIDAFLSATNKG
jgi:hypothetical protein